MAGLTPLCSLFSAPAIAIDPAVRHGVWEGWGASLCWFAKVLGGRNDVADVLFTSKQVTLDRQTVPGLGLNIVRYNAGACSWNDVAGRRMAVSKTILPFRQIEGFWVDGKSPNPNSASWDWTVDASQRSLLVKARDRGVDRFELFSNAPMWWMCANANPSGAADKKADNLPPENYQAFATYLAAVAVRARDHWGISFTSIEPFNEPTSGYWFADGKQEGCQFNLSAQIAFLPVLRAELDRLGLGNLPIAASDETSYDAALAAWRAYPPEIRAIVSRVNVHGYQLARGDRAGLHREVSLESRKPIWNSEHGDKFADGLEMARNIHRDFSALHPTAWCYWQPFDGGNDGGWGLFPADLIAGAIGKANPKYFVLAQYSRHIRPGMTILDSSDANTIAAYDSRARTLVIVSLNDGPACSISYDLSRFTTAGRVSRVITEPLGSARYQHQPDLTAPPMGPLVVDFPAHSVQTLTLFDAFPRQAE